MSFPTWFKLVSVQNKLIKALQMLWNPKLPGGDAPWPRPRGSEHPLDPSSNKRSLRERIRPLRERDKIPYEVKNSIFNKNGLWQKCLAATLETLSLLFLIFLHTVQTTRSVTPSRRIHALFYEDTRFQVFCACNIFLVTRYWLHGNARNFKFTRKEICARKSRGNPRKEILAWKSVRASKSLQWNPCNNPYSQNSLILTRF